LKEADYNVKLVAPPPELRKGCDLAVEINLVEQLGIERLFKEKDIEYVDITPLKLETSELLDIVKITDFGDWVMVKAGNMKLTEAPRPRDIGFTLCALMLDRALEECLDIWQGGRQS
ncbi:unnamed protein product, partial [marine sediment metagenome]